MPGGDKTGPMGQGPMTGRRLGICGGFNRTGFMGNSFGGGFGRGRGMGFRRISQPFFGQYSPENESDILHAQAEELKSSLKDIENRLAQMEKNSAKEKGK